MTRLIDYLQANMKTVVIVCYVGLVAIATYSATVDTHHAHTWVEHNVPFFWSIFGFCAAAIIIGIASWFGKSGIRVDEDYYDHSIWLDDES